MWLCRLFGHKYFKHGWGTGWIYGPYPYCVRCFNRPHEETPAKKDQP